MDEHTLAETISILRIQNNDDERVEAKKCERQLSNDVWESVSAFGNTSGGILLLGIDQSTGFKIARNFNIDKCIDQFVSGANPKTGKLTNPPQYAISRLSFEKGQVLVVEIAELEPSLKPCFITARGIQNGSYKRVADKDQKLSTTEIFALQNAMTPSPADRMPVSETGIEDLDGNVIAKIIENERTSHPKALLGAKSDKEKLTRLNIIDKKGNVRLGGLLAAGVYPQQFYPKLVIDVMAHPNTTKSSPDGPRYLDRTICEGRLGDAIEDAVDAVAKNLRRVSTIKGSGRKDELEIPEEVLREAIANAAIHREYGPHHIGRAITVDIFPDRVEVTNPGGLWGGKTLDNIADGVSACRNATLMRLMSSTDLPSGAGRPAEGGGGGVPFMIRTMRSKTLIAPDFKADIDQFTVKLVRGGAEIAENREWIERTSRSPLTPHEQSVLLAMRKSETATVQDLRRMLMIDSDEIREAAIRFEREGIIVRIAPDTYKMLADDSGNHPTPKSKDVLLSVLKTDEPLSIREVADLIGKSVPSTRYHINKLVEQGLVVPTASSTSRNRKYLKTQNL